MTMSRAVAFVDKHKGVAALFGGFMSATAGATWWLAKGGAAALITSLTALSQPEIADTLQGLPEYHVRVETALTDVRESQEEMRDAIQQIADSLDAFRLESTAVVEWAPEHSQRLTDAVGGCFAGEECQVFFRGRRTQAGAACELTTARPRLELVDGRIFPVDFSPRFAPVNLTAEFETIPVWINVPGFIPEGRVGVVVLTVYSKCPFAPEGSLVERETFRLVVDIKAPRS